MNAVELEKTENSDEKDRILFVDDEAFILFSLRRLFKQNNIEIDVETDAVKAIDLIKERKYKVIVSDFRMPTMDGAHFLELVKEISPESIRLVLSAHVNPESLTQLVNKSEVYRYLQKPWNDKELVGVIKDSIHKFNGLHHFEETIHHAKKKIDEVEILKSKIQDLEKINAQKKSSEVTPPTLQETQSQIEKDHYLKDILPQYEVDESNSLKQIENLRNEQHAHLNYIINLTSTRIGLHSKRVAQLSMYMAKKMKLDSTSQKNLYFAGLYHDIGKLFELVAQADHSELGVNILSGFSELKEAANFVKYHHYRFDQEGGAQAPIESKILAVVDYFDKAVTKERKEDEAPRSLADIVGSMMNEKGKMFSEEVLDVFKETILNDFKLGTFLNETKIHLTEIETDLVLSRPIFNVEGKMLLNSEYKLTKEVISRLFKHHAIIPIKSPLFVYAKTPEKAFNFTEFLGAKLK